MSDPTTVPSMAGGLDDDAQITAAVTEPDTELPPAVAARVSQEIIPKTFGEYSRAWFKRARGGESGMVPVIVGLIVIVIIFQIARSTFLTPGNLVNLLQQAAPFVLLGMAEVFVLLLGEIDLSAGFVALVGATVCFALGDDSNNLPWWICILAGLVATAVVGGLQGLIITKLKLPSFIVTLAGLLGWQGVFLALASAWGENGGTIRTANPVLLGIVQSFMPVLAGWIVMVVVVLAAAALMFGSYYRRHAANLVTEPLGLVVAKVVGIAVLGIVLMWVCSIHRGIFHNLTGVPWVVPVVLGILAGWTFLLGRTRFGRYVYAIGGNAEAARRAGVNLFRIRLAIFALTGLTAGFAGIVYASRQGSIGLSNATDAGSLVLYAVAAAVIGGTSLFGGRGKMSHALLGGVIIAAIYNGMGLVGLNSAAWQYIVTALVLLAAVIVDALARRGQAAS